MKNILYALGTAVFAATTFYAGQTNEKYEESIRINNCIRPLYEQLVKEEKKGININGKIEGFLNGELKLEYCNVSYEKSSKAMKTLIECLSP